MNINSANTIKDLTLENSKQKKLYAKAKELGILEKDIPTLIPHIDRLANIVIDSYIKSNKRET